MNEERKTKKELIRELAGLKRHITRLEKLAAGEDKKISGQELDQKSRYIFENVKDAMIYLDKEGLIVEVNKEAVKIFGGPKKELVGRHFAKIGIFSPGDIPGLLSSFKTILTGKHTNLNLQIKNKKQEIFFVECSASPMKTGGKISGMIAIMRDITERRRAENLLNIQRDLAMDMSVAQNLNEGLRSCLEAVITASGMDCGGIYLVDDASGALDMVFHKGLSPDFVGSALRYDANSPSTQLVMRGMPVYKRHQDLGVPLDKIRLKEQLRAIAVIPILHNQKVIGCLNISSHSLDEVPAFARGALETIAAQIGSAIARLIVEKSYRESEERYGKILATSPDAILLYDAESRQILDSNDAAVKLYGYGREEFLKMKYTDITAEIEASDNSIKELLSEKINKIPLRYHKKKDSTVFPVEISGSAFKLKGHIVICGIIRDITERKQAEEALRESEQFLQNVFGAIQDGISVLDTDLNVIKTNYWMEKIYADQLPLNGRKCYRVYQRRESPCPWCPSLHTIETGETNTEIVPYPSKDNPTGWIELTAFPVKDEQGRVKNVIEYVKDITASKRAEDAVQNSEERFRNLAEMLPEAVFETDRNLYLTFANRRAFELFGYSDDDFNRGLNGLDMITPEDRDHAKANVARRMKGEDPGTVEYRALKKDGSTFPVLFHANSIMKEDELIGLRGIIVNITERKRIEEALRESERKFRTLIGNIPVVTWTSDASGNTSFVSSNVKDVYGFTPEEIYREGAKLWFGRIHPDDMRRVKKAYRMLIDDRKSYDIEYRIQRKDGAWIWLNDRALFTYDHAGKIRVDGVFYDITERKQSEEALRSSEERYRKLVENATEGIVLVQDRFVKFANPRIEEITSYSREELLSKPFLEFVHPDDREFVIDNQLKRLKGEHIPETYEIRMINKYGETRWLKIGGVIIAWEGKPASLNFVVDITETKRLRELESRAQRLETAGQIAGQVAHDFNNLLAPLITYPEFIRRDLSKNHPALPYLKDIEKAAHKIADINQQLLTLGRRGHYNLVPLNLNDVICETLNELISLPETLVIHTELAGDLMNIKAGRAQIHRMISNMINNARDAMQNIGRIIIKTENFYADNIAVAYGRVPRGEYVKLTISDTGHGISEDIIQKIFDPFYTTKTADKRRGSGLGLSVVDSVVKDHYGLLDLYSKVGEGTSFFFYFPITRENIDDQVSEHIIGGDESVLVVDDDDVQRKVSLKILTSLGYKVTTIESGEKAVELLRQKPHDLLFLDMIMTPGMDGTETLKQAFEIKPAQKAIIASGFAESQRVQEALELGAGAFIRKPITIKKMAAAVRKELDRKEKIPVH